MVSSSKNKKKKVSKITFGRVPEVKNKQNHLKDLLDQRFEIEECIENIVDDYNSLSATDENADSWLERLPINSLSELQNFAAGKKKESNLEILRLRSQLRKDKDKQFESLKKVDDLIYIGEIDILMAKLNHLIKKIDS